MYSYVISGLSVLSDVTLPGLIALSNPPAISEVTIRAGDVPTALDPIGRSNPIVS